MFDEREKAELDLLVGMGKRQAGKLSSMIIPTVLLGFPQKGRQKIPTWRWWVIWNGQALRL